MPRLFRQPRLDRLWAALAAPRVQRLLSAAFGLFILLFAADALARAGGGSSFSGGGSSSGGGSWSSGGEGEGIFIFVRLLIWLCIEYPIIGIPLTIAVGLGVIITCATSQKKNDAWSTVKAGSASTSRQAWIAQLRAKFRQLRQIDPAFSRVLFEDFVYFLYAELQRARAKDSAALVAYASPNILRELRDRSLADVTGIIIGAMRIQDIHGLGGPRIAIDVRIESNVVEVSAETGIEYRYYLVQRLRLARDASARSRPAERAQVLDCPNCGAPFDAIRGTTCTYCHQELSHGRFDWCAINLTTDRRERRGPLLTEDVPEVGTDLPTLRAPDAQAGFAALIERDPALDWDSFAQRIREIWGNVQQGWSERDVSRIRPFISDNLFQSMVYWIDLYLAQKCRNVNENGRVQKIILVDVTSDATFDAVTVRLYATGLDYTISDDGKLLSGSRTRPRDHSEYWTLIRGRACQSRSIDSSKCPNCGGPLDISMAGNCAYCQAKVTSGNFDWVLSRIEQDESYGG